MTERVRRVRKGSRSRALPHPGVVGVLAILAAAGACGRGVFSGSSSSSSGGGSGSGTVRSVYVSNFADGKVSALNDASGTLGAQTTIGSGTANGPLGLAVFPSIALYAANAADNKIHEFSIVTNGNPSALATIAAGASPQQLAIVPGDAFAYAINAGGSISQYTINSSTGELSKNTPGSITSGLIRPVSAVATSSFLYVTDPQNGAGVVQTYAISGSGTLALASTIGTGPNPNQIIIDPSDTWVIVSDATNGEILVFEVSGNGLALVALTPVTNSPATGLAYATTLSGNTFVFAANPQAGSVSTLAFNTGTGALTLVATTTGLSSPNGLAVDSTGSFLFVTNQGNGTVSSYTIDSVSGALALIGDFGTQNPLNTASSPNSIVTTD